MKRTASVHRSGSRFDVTLKEGPTVVDSFPVEKRSQARFHADRWVKEGRRIIRRGNRGAPPGPRMMTDARRKKAAAKRVMNAELFLYRAMELMEKAQAELSAISTGLNQNYAKIGALRGQVKDQMYDLGRCRQTGLCMVDETVMRVREAVS